ncbi:MAG: hypothetical protein RL173_740 [Fibrobacterota bacterium]
MSTETVPKGYKRTEIGVIPEEWSVTTVGAEFSMQLGKMLDSEKNLGVEKPFLGNRSVQWSKIDCSDLGLIKLTSSDLQKYRLHLGDILVCEGGEIGRSAIWEQQIDECYFQKALHRLRPKNGFSASLFVNLLQRYAATGYLQNFVTQTSIAHLPKDKFETIQIPAIPKAEQKAIATALSDADTLIESLEQLIAKKRQIKQGAMQELLTGKRRLPGFTGKWETKRLGDLFTVNGGVSASRDQLSDTGYCYLHYGDIHVSPKNYIDVRREYAEIPKLDVGLSKVSPGSLLKTGDVVFVDASEDDSGTSKHFVIVNDDNLPYISGLHTIAAKSKGSDIDLIFKRYCFQTVKIKEQFKFYAVGTKVSGVSKSNIIKIDVSYPSLPEQTAIASVLSDMDTELEALEGKLDKARQVKQGMMQQLLTGKVRLV